MAFPCINAFSETEVLVSQAPFESAVVEKSEAVDDSYFDDAVFIGDSLTLSIESRNILKNAKFIADIGASISNAANSRIFPYEGKQYKLTELLQKFQPKKIYILIGTNTLTFSRSGDAIEPYKELLNVIIKDFPQAPVYMITIPTFRNHAIKKLHPKYPDFTNKRILDFNKRLVELAETAHCHLLDLCSELITSAKDIQPKKEYMAPDGYHLSMAGAELFKEFIKTHTVGN